MHSSHANARQVAVMILSQLPLTMEPARVEQSIWATTLPSGYRVSACPSCSNYFQPEQPWVAVINFGFFFFGHGVGSILWLLL